MINSKLIALFLFLSMAINCFGDSVSVEGRFKGAQSRELIFIAYDDLISYRKIILHKTKTDHEGYFSANLESDEVKLITIELEHLYYEFYMEPGGEYILESDSLEFSDEYRPFYNRNLIPLKSFTEPEPGLNSMVSDFEGKYSEFVLAELSGINQVRSKNIVSKFKEQMAPVNNSQEIQFIRDFIEYRTAQLELAITPSRKADLFEIYLENRPVLYFQPEYMGFFREFFKKHIYPLNRFISRDDLRFAINVQGSFSVLLDTLGKDTLLRNEIVRELVCLSSLGKLYFDNSFSKQKILDILEQAAENSKFQMHRKIATNLIFELTVLKEDQPAPDFKLPVLHGDSLAGLNDFLGKPVYIGFFTTWSYACLAEFELMKGRFRDYAAHIRFVTIALDRDRDIVEKFKAEKGYDWIFLYNGLDYDLIFDYRIKTFPSFVLIGSDGNIVDYPAYKPSEIINERFDLLIRKQKQKESTDPDIKR